MPRPFDPSEALFLIEDQLAALLRLSCTERALYYHLLRHTHAKGTSELRTSRRALAGSFGVCVNTIYLNVRKLIHKGCARLIDRRLDGLVLEVRAPQEILDGASLRRRVNLHDLESADFFRIDRLRAAILRREGYKCFYCLRELPAGAERFDHVVPVRAGGDNSFRNIVACCFECNSHKGAGSARAFVRSLYRSGRLSSKELDGRLAALRALSAGKLIPQVTL